MAILSKTGLETHPVGTANVNGIINANWQTLENLATTTGWARPAFAAITYASTITPSFTGAKTQRCALTNNVTVAFANIKAGFELALILTADASTRNLTWPVGVVWLGTAPATLAAGKTLLVRFTPKGTTAADVYATFDVEP